MIKEKITDIFKNIGKIIIGIVFLVTIISSFQVVDQGERGVVLRLGEISRVVTPGVTFLLPFMDDIKIISVRTIREDATATASSKDLQDVSTTVAVQFNVEPAEDKIKYVYSKLGMNFKQTIVEPSIQEATKAASAVYSAEELITKRHEVKEKILNSLKERLAKEGIRVTNVDIVNFQFSSSFNHAIESKVKAEQEALKEKNNLDRIKYEAEQKIVTAKAESEKIKIESEALRQNGKVLIEKIKAEAYLEAVKRWDGRLPQQMIPGSTVPFVNLK